MMSNELNYILHEYHNRRLTYKEIHRGRLEIETHDIEHADTVAKQSILNWVAEEILGGYRPDWSPDDTEEAGIAIEAVANELDSLYEKLKFHGWIEPEGGVKL